MTHFLGRLVERARGTAPRVEPIIAPRFAPAPVAEIAYEMEAPRAVDEAVPERKTPNASKEVVVRPEASATERPRRKEKPATREVDDSLTKEAIADLPETLLVPLRRPDDEKVALHPERTRRSESLQKDLIPPIQSVTAEPLVRRTNRLERTVARRPSARRAILTDSVIRPNESMSDERPIVRVTIGRIDVRAAPASSTPSRQTAPRSEPKLTLDAYLKARKEGAR